MEQSPNGHGDDVQACTAFGENQASGSALIGAAQTKLQILMKKLEEINELEKAYLREESLSAALTPIAQQLQLLANALNGGYDFGADRAKLDNVYKHLNEMTELASSLQCVLTEQIEQLCGQSEAQRAFCKDPTTTPYDITIKEHAAEPMASSEELTGIMMETFCKLLFDTDQLAKHFAQCKLRSE